MQVIVDSSSRPGPLVLDAFWGSGTTLLAAEGLRAHRHYRGAKCLERIGAPRRWAGCDLSLWAIHVARTRLSGLSPKPFFEIQGPPAAQALASDCEFDVRIERSGRRVRVHLDGGRLREQCRTPEGDRGSLAPRIRWCVDLDPRDTFHVDWEDRYTQLARRMSTTSLWYKYPTAGAREVRVKLLDAHGREAARSITSPGSKRTLAPPTGGEPS